MINMNDENLGATDNLISKQDGKPIAWARGEIETFAKPVPRYTSYPAAPHFNADADAGKSGEKWMASLDVEKPVSIYIHIPFCDKLCWFCGCHTKQILRYDPIKPYLEALYCEMAMVSKAASGPLKAGHVHFGGGSPSMLKADDMVEIRQQLEDNFLITDDTVISVEIDPSDVTDDTLEGLNFLGLTRASIGVQDFNEKVQHEINRHQSFQDTRMVSESLRAMGISSLNIDALYGLPHQTLDTLRDSLEKVISLKPDRLAMFGYAHVPWIKKHQRMIDETALPDIFERFDQARLAEQVLTDSGYSQIGIDHFALQNDSLLTAQEKGKLHRNFQGYTDDSCDDIIALGASSIGKTKKGYYQNISATGNYIASIKGGELPVEKSYELTLDDRVRAAVIQQLMCYFKLDISALRDGFCPTGHAMINEQIAKEAELLLANTNNGYLEKTDNGFEITPQGRPFTRTFAAHFDAWLKKGSARYSIAV